MKKGKRLLVVLLATLAMVIGAVSMSYAALTHLETDAVTVTTSGAKLDYHCNNDLCNFGAQGQSYTVEIIQAVGDDLVYNGDPHAMMVSGLNSSTAEIVELYNNDQILYEGDNYSSTTAPTDAGDYTATVKIHVIGSNTNTYYTLTKSFTIAKRQVSLTWGDKDAFTYNGREQAPSVTATGLIDDDDVYVDVSGETDSNAKTGEEKYTATATLVGDDAGNYKFADDTVTKKDFWIDQKGVTVSGLTSEGKTYDGTSDATIKYEGIAQIEGIVSGDNLFVNSATGYFYDGNDENPTKVKDAGNGIRIKLEADTYDSDAHKVTKEGTVTLGGNDKENYYVAKVQKNLKGNITPVVANIKWTHDIPDVRKNPGNALIYNGKYQKPVATVTNIVEADKSDGVVLEVKVNGEKKNANAHLEDHYNAKAVDIVNEDGDENNNYTLSGSKNLETEFIIYPRKVALKWIGDIVDVESDGVYSDGLVYNGEEQAPTIDIQEAEPGSSDGLIKGDDLDYWIDGAMVDSNAKSKKDSYPATVEFSNYNYTLGEPLEKRDNKDSTEFRIYQKSVETVSWKDTHKGETSPVDSDGTVFIYDGKYHYMNAYPKSSAIVPGDEPVEITVVHQDVRGSEKHFADNNRWIDSNIKSGYSKYVAYAESLSDLNYTLYVSAIPSSPDFEDDVEDIDRDFRIDQLEAVFSWDKTKFTYDGQHQAPKGTVTNLQDNEETGKTDECEVEKYWYRITSDGDLGDIVDMTIDAGTYRVYPVVLSDNNYRPKFSLDQLFWDHEDYQIFARPVEIKWTPNAREYTYDANMHEYSAKITNVVQKRQDTKEADVVNAELGGIWREANAGSYTAKIIGLKSGTDHPVTNYTLLANEINGDKTTLVKDASIKWKINKRALTVTVYDKVATYGDDPATFKHTVKYSGLVNGNTNKDDNHNNTNVPGKYTPTGGSQKNVVEGTLVFSSPYQKWSKPGAYPISASGLKSDNYAISYVNGTLTVRDKVLPGGLVAMAKAGNKKGTLIWNSVDGAAAYQIWFSKCNTKKKQYNPKYLTTVVGNSYKVKKLKAHAYYKFYVVAIDAAGTPIAVSPMGHFVTNNSMDKWTNPKTITPTAASITVSKGGNAQVGAVVTKVKKGKKYKLTNGKHTAKVRYLIDNPEVATADMNGVVYGVGSGWCRLYVIAANGMWQVVEVNVN